ncbi:MAG: glycosyltransferase [Saprospiraceae bacterium]
MRILFLTKIDFSIPATGGLFRKVRAQADALARRDGWEVDLFFIHGLEAVLERHDGQVIRIPFASGLKRAMFTNSGLFRLIRNNGYQSLYIRHFLLNPVFAIQLIWWKLRRGQRKILLELPTFPYGPEFRDDPWIVRMQVALDRWTFGLLPFCIDRIVTFSGLSRIRGIQTIVTDNGVDPQSLSPIPEVPPSPPFRILGLANLNIWHGYDRIIRGLADFRDKGGEGDIRFEIAGTGKEEQNLRDLVSRLHLDDQVFFHGFLTGASLDQLIASCHVGAASLGMHRTGVAEGQTTTLKAREFAARGLPFILGYSDRDFTRDYPFCLVVPANEEAIDPIALQSFFQQLVTAHPRYMEDMRKDASRRLSWDAKLAPAISFLDQN